MKNYEFIVRLTALDGIEYEVKERTKVDWFGEMNDTQLRAYIRHQANQLIGKFTNYDKDILVVEVVKPNIFVNHFDYDVMFLRYDRIVSIRVIPVDNTPMKEDVWKDMSQK